MSTINLYNQLTNIRDQLDLIKKDLKCYHKYQNYLQKYNNNVILSTFPIIESLLLLENNIDPILLLEAKSLFNRKCLFATEYCKIKGVFKFVTSVPKNDSQIIGILPIETLITTANTEYNILKSKKDEMETIYEKTKQQRILQHRTENNNTTKQELDNKEKQQLIDKEMAITLLTQHMTPNEAIVVYNGMDRTNYSILCKDCKRFLDIDKIINDINVQKAKTSDIVLIDLYVSMSLDSYPPRNSYAYKYIYPDNSVLSIGEITFDR